MKYALMTALGALTAGVGLLGAIDDTPVHAQSSVKLQYPEARFPANLREPTSINEIMPYARAVARNKSGIIGLGLGEIKAGEKVLIVTTRYDQKMDMYTTAVVRALKERNVTATLVHDYDILGLTRAEAEVYVDYMNAGRTSADGWVEGCNLLNKDYLLKARPDLYKKCHPREGVATPANIKAIMAKLGENRAGRGLGEGNARVVKWINDYLDKNTDYRGVFYGRAGPIWMRFHPKETRWMGMFVSDNKHDVMASNAGYPADVWLLSEEQTMEPMPSVDRVTVTDPEGTNVAWNLTERQARNWAKGVYLRGHLFMFPQEAYGQYGLSVVNYPALDPEYIPVDDSVLINGTIAATKSHAGFMPRMVETWKNGYLVDVKGGGTYGELVRTLMKQPGINTTVWPQRKRPGYFQFFETALGTNPKIIRNSLAKPFGVLPERGRDGAIHWALGAIYWNDPGSGGGESSSSGKLAEFAKKTGLPGGHGIHKHTYFNTMKMHLRGSNKWVTTINKGRLTALDNPEVRALASRYGNPDQILANDWVEDVPGVSVPGNYAEYARDPYKYSLGIEKKIDSGNYKYFYPRKS